MSEQGFTEAMTAVADYAIAHQKFPMNCFEECWEEQIDEHWWIAGNGHNYPVECSKGVEVQSFHVYVEFNGWPAGVINPFDGVLAAGELANEETFIAALKEKTPEEAQSF
jgi:hypothetical protein